MIKKMMEKKKNQEGFTLIELIIVIAIIGILAVALMPKFAGFTDRAKGVQVLSDAKNIATAVEGMMAEGKTFIGTDKKSEVDVMAFVGKELGGKLEMDGTTDGKFKYTKKTSGRVFEVTYDIENGNFGDGPVLSDDQTTAINATKTK